MDKITDKEHQDPISEEKKNAYLEYALFLILGILLGIVIKTEAAKRITIGYEDYRHKTDAQIYDFNQLKKNLMEKSKKEQEAQQDNAAEAGNSSAESEN